MDLSAHDRILAGPLYGTEPWPLRFNTHQFSAVCFNTLACSIVYNRFEFGTRKVDQFGVSSDAASGPLPSGGLNYAWNGAHTIPPKNGKTFPGPVDISWTSMDGEDLHAVVDLDEMFRERLVLHHVTRDEVKEPWLRAKSFNPVSPHILIEVNDRTVNVYMQATVATEAEQIQGNPNSHIRSDVMLAWSHRY
ncbi:hypothetical protein KPL74_20795 [Bacillus sp. NP157]|nr:hypothetical protein KPL74_20795 [Bacillus sp. NP157]